MCSLIFLHKEAGSLWGCGKCPLAAVCWGIGIASHWDLMAVPLCSPHFSEGNVSLPEKWAWGRFPGNGTFLASSLVHVSCDGGGQGSLCPEGCVCVCELRDELDDRCLDRTYKAPGGRSQGEGDTHPCFLGASH